MIAHRINWKFATVALAAICSFNVAVASAADRSYDISRDHVYAERDTGSLKADVYTPRGDGPFPAVLVVHGGAWMMGTRTQLAGAAEKLAENGYVAVAINYRLAPQSKFPAQIYDCQAAVRWMREHASEFKIDPTRIGGFGYSAGGQLVALLGSLDNDDFNEPGLPADAPSARLQCVLAGGAPCEFRILPIESKQLAYWLGGTPGEKPDAYQNASPTAFVTNDDPPMYFYHGGNDEIVPIRSVKRMVEVLQEAHVPVEFYEVPNGTHLTAAFDADAMQHALAFADKYLKNRNTANIAAKSTAPPQPAAAGAPDGISSAPETPHAQ
jgi:acetyl esterase/lipase